MIIELIRKELIKGRTKKPASKLVNFAKYLAIGLLFAAVVVFEVFIFMSLDEKINTYSEGGSFHFLIFFLFIIMIISIGSTALRARNSIFDETDKHLIAPLPITSDEVIIAKMISVYVRQVVLNLIISTPLLVTYGATRGMIPYYYVFCGLYPFIISLLNVGVGLILVIVIEGVYRLIKNREIIQIILASIGVIFLCYIYQYLLQLFLDALNDSQIGGVFSPQFINFITTNSKLLFPIYPLCEAILLGKNIPTNICFFFGFILVSLVFGFFVVSYFHSVFIKHTSITRNTKKVSNECPKLTTRFIALMNKEMGLLFKNSTFVFSYTALLIMCPFLSYVVISSLSAIVYNNLSFYTTYFPEIVNSINIALILLFSSVINSTATMSISREGKALQIIKYLPIHSYKQVVAKISIPMIFSSLSLLITLIALISTGTITWTVFIVAGIIGATLIIINTIIGVVFDMHDKGPVRYRLTPLLKVVSIGFPLVIFILQFILSITRMPTWAMYLTIIGLDLILFGLSFIKIRSRFTKAFRRMEAN